MSHTVLNNEGLKELVAVIDNKLVVAGRPNTFRSTIARTLFTALVKRNDCKQVYIHDPQLIGFSEINGWNINQSMSLLQAECDAQLIDNTGPDFVACESSKVSVKVIAIYPQFGEDNAAGSLPATPGDTLVVTQVNRTPYGSAVTVRYKGTDYVLEVEQSQYQSTNRVRYAPTDMLSEFSRSVPFLTGQLLLPVLTGIGKIYQLRASGHLMLDRNNMVNWTTSPTRLTLQETACANSVVYVNAKNADLDGCVIITTVKQRGNQTGQSWVVPVATLEFILSNYAAVIDAHTVLTTEFSQRFSIIPSDETIVGDLANDNRPSRILMFGAKDRVLQTLNRNTDVKDRLCWLRFENPDIDFSNCTSTLAALELISFPYQWDDLKPDTNTDAG